MLGFMLKDVYAMKKQIKIVLLISLFYVGISIVNKNIAFLSFLVLFADMGLILATFSYDDKGHWEKYARILPISYQKMVLSRYTEVLIVNGAMFVIFMPITIFLKEPGQEMLEVISLMVTAICAGIILLSIMFPIIYKVGIEKARIMVFILVFIPVFLGAILNTMDININMAQLAANPIAEYISYHLYFICPLIAAVFLVVSYLITNPIVANKEY